MNAPAATFLARWNAADERQRLLQVIQPALIGLAAALGAAISMGMSEGLSDDGQITGRGAALTRGMITGIATFVGGTAHALPFLISNIHTALTVAYIVVSVELVVIAWVRKRFLGVALRTSLVQVTLGRVIV